MRIVDKSILTVYPRLSRTNTSKYALQLTVELVLNDVVEDLEKKEHQMMVVWR